MSYSLDFRRKVFEVKAKKGLTFEETSEHFRISIRTLFRWKSFIEPVMKRNKPATKIDMEALLRDVESNPDDYQHERAERFGVSQRGIGIALKRLGVSCKETLRHPKADEELRTKFQEEIKTYQLQGK